MLLLHYSIKATVLVNFSSETFYALSYNEFSVTKIFLEVFKSVNLVAFNLENQPARTKTSTKLSKQVFINLINLIFNLRGIHAKDAN